MSDKLKEKIGDWCLDVAKYLFTVIALSSVLDGLAQPISGVLGALMAVLIFVMGMALIAQSDNKNDKSDK